MSHKSYSMIRRKYSKPEKDEYISCHVRAVGPWTKLLRKTFADVENELIPKPKMLVDGPFGEGEYIEQPTQFYFFFHIILNCKLHRSSKLDKLRIFRISRCRQS